jgi:signal transduction histidine kinase
VAVILISSYFTDSPARVQGLESGADAYLAEPVDDAELVATVRAIGRVLRQLRDAREHQRLLDALLEYVPEGIAVATAPGLTLVRTSRYGRSISGREPVLGVPMAEQPTGSWLFRPGSSTPSSVEDWPITRAVRSGDVVTDEEWMLKRPDGAERYILLNAGPIKDGKGQVTGGVAVWRDITSRKEMELELVRQADALRAADQAKNEFLARVVHELRQPLQAILSAVGIMKLRVDRSKGEYAREVVERQATQMSRITDDLLDAARVVRGQVAMNLQPEDLGKIVSRALETVRPAVTERGHLLHVALPDAPVVVAADTSRLQQVFVNILSNAARYTPAGGEIRIAIDVAPSRAAVHVTDTGAGISRADLSRIFDLFVRASTEEGGLGIGLAVARTVVEKHGGTIEARSGGAGCGAEFVVTLPTMP